MPWPMSGKAAKTRTENLRAKSNNVYLDETRGVPTDNSQDAQVQGTDVQEPNFEAEEEVDWVSGFEEGTIREYSHSTWVWTRCWNDVDPMRLVLDLLYIT